MALRDLPHDGEAETAAVGARAEHSMEAFKDAIMAYSVYCPLVDFLSAIAIACVIWFGGRDVMAKIVVKSVSIAFDPHAPLSYPFALVAVPA